MAENTHHTSVSTLKWLAGAVILTVLAVTFVAYFHPDLRAELAGFWAMCVAALR
jgi:hypothetical protein